MDGAVFLPRLVPHLYPANTRRNQQRRQRAQRGRGGARTGAGCSKLGVAKSRLREVVADCETLDTIDLTCEPETEPPKPHIEDQDMYARPKTSSTVDAYAGVEIVTMHSVSSEDTDEEDDEELYHRYSTSTQCRTLSFDYHHNYKVSPTFLKGLGAMERIEVITMNEDAVVECFGKSVWGDEDHLYDEY
ncbi:hypothetical protein CYLTODRAFT_422965 [Cylindrobasidium torrendii FP15055 ss-10]|uniref:Uncharacterized protein n=1 Tax=Cylindrobasidium torrendii FP15055 ss-10 TaxID=1314674 RepID=A0A0D7BBR3_9AGAR|nr:hypothetical protein CYLTODRAFT_422965 [Cylindrobasidium torrendii FP15055 ss-10]